MKRVLAVCLFILILAFTSFAGHTVGGNKYCGCATQGCLEDYPGECSYKLSADSNQASSSNAPVDATAELGIVIVALMLWLRLRA
jgi:hypothetical protein